MHSFLCIRNTNLFLIDFLIGVKHNRWSNNEIFPFKTKKVSKIRSSSINYFFDLILILLSTYAFSFINDTCATFIYFHFRHMKIIALSSLSRICFPTTEIGPDTTSFGHAQRRLQHIIFVVVRSRAVLLCYRQIVLDIVFYVRERCSLIRSDTCY